MYIVANAVVVEAGSSVTCSRVVHKNLIVGGYEHMPILAAFMVPHPPMIVPEVGRGSEKQIKSTIEAYERVADEIAALKPDTIIISSPHSVLYAHTGP